MKTSQALSSSVDPTIREYVAALIREAVTPLQRELDALRFSLDMNTLRNKEAQDTATARLNSIEIRQADKDRAFGKQRGPK